MNAHKDYRGELSFSSLSNFLRETHSPLSVSTATQLAVKEWMYRQMNGEYRSDVVADGARGYLWKTLFLPDGTLIRMSYADTTYHAKVVGDEIIYEGRAVSPRQLTLAIAGDGRNAWRDLDVRFPGDPSWKSANARRADLKRQGQPKSLTPAQSMELAANSMTDALNAALALVASTRAVFSESEDRRRGMHRRAEDEDIAACLIDCGN